MGFPHSLKSTSMKGCKEGVAPGNLGNRWKSGNTTSTEHFQIHGYLATWLPGYLLTQQRNISHLRYCSTHQTTWRLSTPDLQGNCDVCVCVCGCENVIQCTCMQARERERGRHAGTNTTKIARNYKMQVHATLPIIPGLLNKQSHRVANSSGR